ncbi:Pex24p-domain-containing protein [Aspergillus taichungensis]|uniref:Pex24p-domain-containing protein n=1 Tax=Aspergillus taichungensis TaxID=482145 RepID=A0A2J5HQI8_9EURO|nr:Pex24p-domain-containing protein [Aspergillus taichungensis]
MDESTPDAIVNRNEPVPVISAGKTKDDAKPPKSKRSSHTRSGSRSLQDRLFTKILEQVVPRDGEDGPISVEDRLNAADAQRPAFSLPLMGNNFRRFNARIGVVFHFQNQVERVLNWKHPSHTFSFLFAYSLICLEPHLLVVLPMMVFLLFVMVPAFLARHPPPPAPSTSSIMPYYSFQGPALAPAKTITPASETSKDFFRNMRDLQNSMADFSDVHDSLVSVFAPLTNFSNERLSSAVFLMVLFATIVLFAVSDLMPWRIIALIGGNVAILSKHPSLQDLLQTIASDFTSERSDRDRAFLSAHKEALEAAGLSLDSLPSDPSAAMSLLGSLADITLDTYPEEREVEIFEIQWRSLAPFSETPWEHFVFSSLPYDPLSPYRFAGDRPKGCRFFEDVRPPTGWAWKSKKWELDLDCREWVVERMITGVGFEVSGSSPDEGSSPGDEIGGWVWDLPSDESHREDTVVAKALGHDTFDADSKPSTDDTKAKRKGKGRVSRDFEEKGGAAALQMGEWRRRRWVRIVHRVSVPSEAS